MEDKLNKTALALRIAREANLTQTEARRLIDAFCQCLSESLAAHQAVVLSGFGTFWVSQRQPRPGIHPRTGERIWLPETVIPKFKPGRKLAQTVNHFQPMSEKRKLKRRNFIFDIGIVDRDQAVDSEGDSGVIGDLADITVEGLMLVSEVPIAENTMFSLRINLPEPIRGQQSIDFTARSIRCIKTIHETIFTTGFQIVDLDEPNRALIQTLIDEYAV